MANEPEEAKVDRRVPKEPEAASPVVEKIEESPVVVAANTSSVSPTSPPATAQTVSSTSVAAVVSVVRADAGAASANSAAASSTATPDSAVSNQASVAVPTPVTGDSAVAPVADPPHNPALNAAPDPDPYHDHYHDYDHQYHQEPTHQHDDFPQPAYVPPAPPDEPSSVSDDDGEGGPVKPFLEHLEDFRWLLIKCVVATLIGMVVCLAAGNSLMELIKLPLLKAAERNDHEFTKQLLIVMAGTNLVGRFEPPPEMANILDFGTNRRTVFELAPVRIGSNAFLAFVPSTNPAVAYKPAAHALLNLTPAGGFMVAFQLAIYGGIVLASPFLIFFIGQFLLPALKLNEKHYLLRGFFIGVFLFLGGVTFCYFKLMPLALDASAKYSQWLGISADQWTAENYISFVCKFMLGMGLGFELPVVILIFVKLGVLNYKMLAGFRRYMIVINLVLGAVLTTPEVLTQVMMAIPLQILYEITVWIAWYWEWRDKKRAEKAAAK